jgi:hypothetical protein
MGQPACMSWLPTSSLRSGKWVEVCQDVAGVIILRHVSNPLDNVDLVQAQNCQAESLTFDACLK